MVEIDDNTAAYAIPENIEHSFEIKEAGEVIGVFTPIRQDYL